MSLRLLLHKALAAAVHDADAHKRELRPSEAALNDAEPAAPHELLRAPNYDATARDAAVWDPVALAQRNPTNDPAHAATFMWANQPSVMDQGRRLVGLVEDDDADAALRRVETRGHIQRYLPAEGAAPALHTAPPTPGYMALPGRR